MPVHVTPGKIVFVFVFAFFLFLFIFFCYTFQQPGNNNKLSGGGLFQKSVLKTTLQKAEMVAELDAILSKMLLGFLTPNQLLSPGCIANSLLFVQLNSF